MAKQLFVVQKSVDPLPQAIRGGPQAPLHSQQGFFKTLGGSPDKAIHITHSHSDKTKELIMMIIKMYKSMII